MQRQVLGGVRQARLLQRAPVPRIRGPWRVSGSGRRHLAAPPPRASSAEQDEYSQPSEEETAFAIAASRLQELLQQASWDQSEAVRSELATYSPAMKLTFLSNIGCLITMVAFGISWMTGEDPLGGVRLSQSSLDAAEAGALASVPLVLASLLTRTRHLRAAMPLMEDLHAAQATLLQPLLKDLNLSQLLIVTSTTMLPMLLLLLPAMHGLATLLADVTQAQVVQPVIAAGATAMQGASHDVLLVGAAGSAPLSDLQAVGSGAAAGPLGADLTVAKGSLEDAAKVATSMELHPAATVPHATTSTSSTTSPPWAWLLHSPMVHNDAAASFSAVTVDGSSTSTAVASSSSIPATDASSSTPSPWMLWHPLSADMPTSAYSTGVPFDSAAHAQPWAQDGSDSTSTGAAFANVDDYEEEEDDVAPSWWTSLQLMPLSPPTLLPLGVPDLPRMAHDLAMGSMEPGTAILVRNVGREALSLMPAILSGFVAAYTVMRQLAPRRSQVWAIRDALMASDRFFRLHVSMARPLPTTTTSSTMPSLSSSDDSSSSSPSSSSAPSPTNDAQPPAACQTADVQGSQPSTATSPSQQQHESHDPATTSMAASREQLVAQLALQTSTTTTSCTVPSSADASAAVSDAFRKVAVMWLLTRRKVCQLSYLLTSMSFIFYALCWSETGDLAAPATAALISVTTELWLCQRDAGVATGGGDGDRSAA